MNAVSICPALLENYTSLFDQNHRALGEALQEASCLCFSLLSVLQATDSWQENSGVIRMPKILGKKAAADSRDRRAGLLAPRAQMCCVRKCNIHYNLSFFEQMRMCECISPTALHDIKQYLNKSRAVKCNE
ncbi:hypothetical protein QQF64_011449 [Cirrhinus molitorella]|uniref:Insulin-like domain-containing protein n=1 Tax=Cirrhinus molitorella TaxID=172907 RepID=A0ABR3M0V1_9TELE